MRMGYTGNFTRVTFVDNDRDMGGPALRVEGTSEEAEDARAITVALPHAGAMLMAPVQDGSGSEEWSATFAQGDPPFGTGQSVIVVGIAMLHSTNQPFVWANELPITATTDPP
jgi:hypothetical protein